MKLVQVVARVIRHPLNRGKSLAALVRLVRWQLAVRILPEAEFAVPFVNGTRLLAKRGMTTATANFYSGLAEHDEMGFVLHVLRPGDLFVDVGANIGSYSVLAASVGARAIAVEPVPATFDRLMANIRLNQMESAVVASNVGLSDRTGFLRFTTGEDALNHVVTEGERGANVEIPVATLDALLLGERPAVIKIDVEGHELPVITGASSALASPSLLAVLMETNGLGLRYGVADSQIYERMAANGLDPYSYSAMTRVLAPLDVSSGATPLNTVFIRRDRLNEAQERIARAPRATLVNGSI